jgi:hypothetical protein
MLSSLSGSNTILILYKHTEKAKSQLTSKFKFIHLNNTLFYPQYYLFHFFFTVRAYKGQFHKVYYFSLFSWIIVPKAPENNSSVVSNFFKYSRRYSQVKVHHLVSTATLANFPPAVTYRYDAPWAVNISAHMGYSEAGGNWFIKKNLKSKNSWHCPINL